VKTRRLGRVAYEPTWRAMQAFTQARGAESPDELWLLEHPPVYTLGLAGRDAHVHAPGTIPVVRTDRGGQVTYHGPGQVVAYPLLDLRRLGIGVRELVRRLEQAVIEVLRTYGVDGVRIAGRPGIYVEGRKIAALGLRVARGCSYHGIALNVDLPLEPFGRIDPCGFPGLESTSLAALGVRDSIDAVQQRLGAAIERALAGEAVPA
jgi:lipoyl(octanoyl) transferase